MLHLSNCVLAQSGNLAGIQGVVGTADPLLEPYLGSQKEWCSGIKWIKMHHFLNLKSYYVYEIKSSICTLYGVIPTTFPTSYLPQLNLSLLKVLLIKYSNLALHGILDLKIKYPVASVGPCFPNLLL